MEPPRNHWWHVPLYLTPRGAGTGPIPAGQVTFELDFDLIDHRLVIIASDGRTRTLALPGLSVADFYRAVLYSSPRSASSLTSWRSLTACR